MSLLHKKCFIASSGLHVLLVLILLTCPAFLAPSPKQSDVQPITIYPDLLLDTVFSGGGNPSPGRPPVSVPAPQPPAARPPQPAPEVRPKLPREQPKETPKEVNPQKLDPDSLEVTKEPTRKKPEVTLVAVNRASVVKSKPKDTSAEDNKERQERQERQERDRQIRALGQLDSSLDNIKSGIGAATKIDGPPGLGGGGKTYAGYASWVLTVYDNAWVAPEDASSEDATVEVSVTIASDGTVIAKRIVKRSGDAVVDASVQRTLDRVTTMKRPFPEGTKDKQRSYIIPFNMKTKRGAA